ncbi:MAG: GNAT family N-acetyltransferase [Muribaculaceae bacterium]|nr:GNAT family N-acetyltransferase [Muribaculaceae bacterium]
MEVRRYTPDIKSEWDAFVRTSKNGTFLFCRDYMEYHSDRFADFSWAVFDDNGKPVMLLPASMHPGGEVRSHGGLTYGGLIMDNRTSAGGPRSPLHILPTLIDCMKREGATSLLYKPVPHIYHRQPAEEDLYALWRMGATLEVRNLASAIYLPDPVKSSRLGKRALKRQRQSGITVEPTDNAADFWEIITEDRRVRHNVTPVHNCAEMQLLHDRFPSDIRFYIARQANEILAGAVIYIANGVLHLQYAAANDLGKELYAVDIIYHTLLFDIFPDARWFDFGISNEDSGRYLNEGMTAHKEEFGARSIVYDMYRLSL